MNVTPKKRLRQVVGSVDTDSAEDTEIDISASSTPKGVRITRRAFTTKWMRINHTIGQTEPVPLNITASPMEDVSAKMSNPADEKKRDQVCLS